MSPTQSTPAVSIPAFKTWKCQLCGFVYDEAAGDPSEGLAPGTRWADVPEEWTCPVCGTPKDQFDMLDA